jgi:hypothetical protein
MWHNLVASIGWLKKNYLAKYFKIPYDACEMTFCHFTFGFYEVTIHESKYVTDERKKCKCIFRC